MNDLIATFWKEEASEANNIEDDPDKKENLEDDPDKKADAKEKAFALAKIVRMAEERFGSIGLGSLRSTGRCLKLSMGTEIDLQRPLVDGCPWEEVSVLHWGFALTN